MNWAEIEELMQIWRDEDELVESVPASAESIGIVGRELNAKFPSSYREFLLRYGAGGPIGADFCGIWDDDPTLDAQGTVLGTTQRARMEGLPEHLLVIKGPAEDGELWCIDTSRASPDGEAPIVFVAGPVHHSRAAPIAATFGEYLRFSLSRD